MINSTMKTFQIITLLALVAASMAFSPQGTFLDPCSHSTRIDVPELHLVHRSLWSSFNFLALKPGHCR